MEYLYDEKDTFYIEGSRAVGFDSDGVTQTEDGKLWVWIDESYRDDDTGYNLAKEGHWEQYKSLSEE